MDSELHLCQALSKIKLVALTLLISSQFAAAADGNAFDPKGYLDGQVQKQTEASEQLARLDIYKLNGKRFHKYSNVDGAVFLPATGELPELVSEFALCDQHLPLLDEVLLVREKLPAPKALADGAKKELVLKMIRKCREGRVPSPTARRTAPDGAVIEIKAKDKPATKQKAEDPADSKGSRSSR